MKALFSCWRVSWDVKKAQEKAKARCFPLTRSLPCRPKTPISALFRIQPTTMADASDAEPDQTITIGEYLDGIEQEELEADLVLGGDEGKECTYEHGYMKRQAVFSCLTCVPAGHAGVCTACSISCHDGHEVIELWTKRKFKCDCGNSKFGGFYCKLYTSKDPENVDNSYNQNFRGSYCTCSRPYPDPQAEKQVEMMQCCICEDWFHESHIGLDPTEEIPKNEEGEPVYDEFICQTCALTCSFLRLYPATIWATSKQKNVVDTSSIGGDVLEHCSSSCANLKDNNGLAISEGMVKCSSSLSESRLASHVNDSLHGENKAKELGLHNDKAICHDAASSSECTLQVDLSATSLAFEEKKPLFLSKKWRDLLCRCKTCSNFYKKTGLDYLTDKEDSLEEYEKLGKQKREEKIQQQEGEELNFLNGLGHVQKIEILSGINDMKNELASFLESYDSSKPITTADVQGVFENLIKKKKPRRV